MMDFGCFFVQVS